MAHGQIEEIRLKSIEDLGIRQDLGIEPATMICERSFTNKILRCNW